MSKIIQEVNEVLISMGFKEVKSQIVQTEFWNFDTLFEPQDHPARDMQDTFFVKYPNTGKVPKELLEKVKGIHECGTIDNEKISKGWCYKFDENVSKRTVLRTHTTVSSIKYLASLSESERENPHKVFCIDRVFRNETIDYKHLPEFYQCEGIVMAEDVNFDNLVGILKEFLRKLGFEKVRIRPAYFPFTEPSLEAEVYMEGKGWLELLGAGVFRPEVLEPFGIKKPVLAWGIGLSRLAMLRLGLTDIRELHKNDMEWLKKTAVNE
jgi:phenylalanyl-tRNA synthetase alpha chain